MDASDCVWLYNIHRWSTIYKDYVLSYRTVELNWDEIQVMYYLQLHDIGVMNIEEISLDADELNRILQGIEDKLNVCLYAIGSNRQVVVMPRIDTCSADDAGWNKNLLPRFTENVINLMKNEDIYHWMNLNENNRDNKANEIACQAAYNACLSTNGSEILQTLLNSARVRQHFQVLLSTRTTKPKIILMEWPIQYIHQHNKYNYIPISYHIRCYIGSNSELTACSQLYQHIMFDSLNEMNKAAANLFNKKIKLILNEKITNKIANTCMDIMFTFQPNTIDDNNNNNNNNNNININKEKWLFNIIDVKPFPITMTNGQLNMLNDNVLCLYKGTRENTLFDWKEDIKVLLNGPFRFRFNVNIPDKMDENILKHRFFVLEELYTLIERKERKVNIIDLLIIVFLISLTIFGTIELGMSPPQIGFVLVVLLSAIAIGYYIRNKS